MGVLVAVVPTNIMLVLLGEECRYLEETVEQEHPLLVLMELLVQHPEAGEAVLRDIPAQKRVALALAAN